jgi:hypothetical protein
MLARYDQSYEYAVHIYLVSMVQAIDTGLLDSLLDDSVGAIFQSMPYHLPWGSGNTDKAEG